MGSSGAVSEIVESKKGLDSVHQLKGSNMLSIKVKAEERDLESHNYPMDGKEIDLSTSSKVVGPSREMATDMLRKKALKKPVKVGVYRASEIIESFTLKQALRKLCISQASEMAASKWSSKPVDVSDAGTIKRLLASVVAPTSESAGKGKFLEISFVPEKIAKDSSESSSQVDISPASVSSTYRAVSPTAKAQKTRILDVISLTETAGDTPAHVEMKGKAKSKKTVCSSKTGDQLIKPNTSPCLVKLVLRNKTIVKKKGKMETGSALTTSGKFKKMNTEGVVPTKTKSACRKESNSPASNGTNASSDIVVTKNKDGGANKRDISPHSCKTTRNRRTREKGESSLSSKSSIGDNSTSTATSKESHRSSNHSGIRPHMSKDVRWDAIRDVVMQNESLGLENFRLLKRLGCGDIGSVYLSELTGSECLFALKVMDVEFLLSRKKMLRAQTEREILQMLDHPFLPTLYANFTTDNLSCLVMEYCPGGDLHVLRQKQPGRTFSEPAARFYVAEVLLALEYLHMLGVVYRDLKPENILVREDGHIMLTDFDLSLRCTANPTLIRSFSLGLQEPVKRSSGPCAENSCIEPLCIQPSCVQASCFTPRLLLSTTPKTRKPKTDRATQIRLPQLVVEPTDARSNSFVGTHEYLAPEIIIGDGHGSAVDWWTFGIFLYELLFGRTPFKGPGNDETLANIISENLRFPENSAVSTHARDLIRGLLVKEPDNRLGSSRGAAEIKQHPFFEGINWALIRCAQPPEIPRSYDVGTLFGERNKEVKSLDFSSDGDDIEFELF